MAGCVAVRLLEDTTRFDVVESTFEQSFDKMLNCARCFERACNDLTRFDSGDWLL